MATVDVRLLSGAGVAFELQKVPHVADLQQAIARRLQIPLLEQALFVDALECHPADPTAPGTYALVRRQLDAAERAELAAFEALAWDRERPLTPRWRDHGLVAALAVERSPAAFVAASPRLQHDVGFVRRAILDNARVMAYVPPELWQERAVVLAAIRADAALLWKALPAGARLPPDLLQLAVRQEPTLLARGDFQARGGDAAGVALALREWARRLALHAADREAGKLSFAARSPCWLTLDRLLRAAAGGRSTAAVRAAAREAFRLTAAAPADAAARHAAAGLRALVRRRGAVPAAGRASKSDSFSEPAM